LGGVLFTFILFFMRYLLPLMELAVRGVASTGDIFSHPVSAAQLSHPDHPHGCARRQLGLSRLAADSEITAMRASGIGILSFVRIVAIFAVIAWIAGLANSLFVAPRAAAGRFRL
jgi:hypothetical protein